MSTVSAQKITPFLWFDGKAEEAIRLYTSIFPDSEILSLKKWGPGTSNPADWIMMGSFVINGLKLNAFDASSPFRFNESFSMFVECKDQKEIDFYWEKLLEGGGNVQACGWLKDRFGLSWQIVPEMLGEKITSGDPVRTGQMFQALMTMVKIDVAALEAAYNA